MPEDKVLLAVDWYLQGYVNEPYRLNTYNPIGVLNTMKRVTGLRHRYFRAHAEVITGAI